MQGAVGRLQAPWDAGNLLDFDFRHSDPEALENLLEQLPDTSEVPVIEFYYDTRGTIVGMVRCRHCKKNSANHNRGFVLKYSDGSRVLFGKDCGAKQFGEVFVDQEKQFQAARKLQDLQRRKAVVQANRPAALELIEKIQSLPGWATYCTSKRSFRHGLSFAMAELGGIMARHGGRLTKAERVRDYQAEERREIKGKKRPKPIYRMVDVDIGVLNGKSFFNPGPLPDKTLPDVLKRLNSALWTIGDLDRARELEVRLRAIDDLIGELEAMANDINEFPFAASEANMGLLAQWLGDRGHGDCRYRDRQWYRADARGNVAMKDRQGLYRVVGEPAILAELTPPDPIPISLFAELRALVRPT